MEGAKTGLTRLSPKLGELASFFTKGEVKAAQVTGYRLMRSD